MSKKIPCGKRKPLAASKARWGKAASPHILSVIQHNPELLAANSQLKVIAAIPCFNTEPFIGDVVSRAKGYVNEVIVIDDGSTDGTAQVARTAGALVISHDTNKGYGEAIKSCFEVAKTNAADVLVIIDGDGQHNPDEIPGLLAPILNKQADLVIGSRFIRPTQQTQNTVPSVIASEALQSQQTAMPRYRRFGINVITFLCNFGSRTKLSDAQSGFRAYGRKVLDSFSLTESGMGASVEIIIRARAKGLAIKEVPISCLYHSHGSTANPVVHGLGVAFTVVKFRLGNRLHGLSRGSDAGN